MSDFPPPPPLSVPLRGLDVLAPLNSQAIARVAAGNFQFVMRYLKNVTETEVTNIRKAGLKIGMIWETTATRALQGQGAGKYDSWTAVAAMQRFGAPPQATIFATVDKDVNTEAQINAVEDYFVAFDAGISKWFQIGGYANGTALTRLKEDGLLLTWLAGAMGWSGSRDFAKTGNPSLIQGPTLGVNGGHWHAIDWPGLGFQYDPDLAFVEDFGAW